MKYITFVALILALACNRDDFDPVKNEPTVINLLDRYHLKQLKPDRAGLQKTLLGSRIYSEVKDELDFNNVEQFESFQEQFSVYIIGFKDNPNKKYAVKVKSNSKMLVQNEILYSRKMKDQNNGSIGIMKDTETLVITFKNGVSKIDEMDQADYRIQFTKMGFCQRESTQTFKQCYLKEVDEFCDSFISCVALATNPTVSVLIAAACSCDA